MADKRNDQYNQFIMTV